MSRIKRKGFSEATALPSISLCRTRIALTTHIWARWALKLNTNCSRFYKHELLFFRTRDFTNTNLPNNTNEPDGLWSWSFLLEILIWRFGRFARLLPVGQWVYDKYRGLKKISVLCGIRVGQSKKDYTVCLSLHSVGVQPSFSLKRR